MNKLTAALIHVVFFSLVVATGAYWAVRILTPQPMVAPPPLAAPPPREPDATAAARMFGLVQVISAAVSNIQVAGLFAAGRDSSAILVVDGKPPRAYVLGQEVTAGTTLVDVRADGVTLERAGARQELRAPSRAASMPLSSNAPPTAAPAYLRQGNTLTVNSSAARSAAAPVASPALPQPRLQPQPQPIPPAADNPAPGQPLPSGAVPE